MERGKKTKDGEPTMTENRITEFVNMGKVFIDEKGDIFLVKTTQHYKFLLINQNGEPVYEKQPFKVEETHITPETLGFTKKASWEIYVYKTEHEELEEKTVYYSMLLNFEVPSEARYKTAYFRVAKTGRIILCWLDSSTASEVSINDKEFCTRGKAKRLPENSIIQKGSPVFTLNGNGELERRLEEPW
jgi:hypothetical protein